MISSEINQHGTNGQCNATNGWCFPVIIYMFLSVLSIISAFYKKRTVQIVQIVQMIIFNLLWGSLLYYLCAKCHNGWAWFILLLPVILIIIIYVILVMVVVTKNENETPKQTLKRLKIKKRMLRIMN
jgi:uncharacterized membrane protein YbhN (UPF0104 family)